MGLNTSPVGLRPNTTAGVTTPASIDTVQTITVPSTDQRVRGGVMECYIAIEGPDSVTAGATSRYTWNGVTPTASVGQLLPAPAIAGVTNITLVGQDLIEAFKIIGTAAGNKWTYEFVTRDDRG